MAPLQMARPPTSEAFLGHLSLLNEVSNVQNEKARFDVSENAVKKSNWTKNGQVRKYLKFPSLTNLTAVL